MYEVVLIVLAFLNGEATGKLPETLYPDIQSCVRAWNENKDLLKPDADTKLMALCVSDHEAIVLP